MKEIAPLLVLALAAPSDLPRRPFAPDLSPPPPASRAAAETTWIPVHLPGHSPCPPEVAGPHGLDEVWCFEGAGGDSTWPANPSGHWSHWSVFDPRESEASKWHVTTRHGGPSTGTYNAWAGCDSVGTNPDCDTDGWTFQEGYGDGWNYPLVLDCRQEDASAGGTIGFDVAGRRVRTLVNGKRDPGAGTETWEGRADDGRRVSAGAYFARMKAAEFRATRKIVVLP